MIKHKYNLNFEIMIRNILIFLSFISIIGIVSASSIDSINIIGENKGYNGDIKTIFIDVTNAINVDLFQLNLSYDNNIINITNFSKGDDIIKYETTKYDKNNLEILAAGVGPINGNFELAKIDIQVIGKENSVSPLNLTAKAEKIIRFPDIINDVPIAMIKSSRFTVLPNLSGNYNISGFKINASDNKGLSNWNIRLLNNTTGIEIINTTTDDTGYYNFSGLSNDTYNVTEEMKIGWKNKSSSFHIINISGNDKNNINFTNIPTPISIPSNNSTIVAIQDMNGNNNITGTNTNNSIIPISILIKNVKNLAAATIRISYNPSIVIIQDVTTGNLGVPISNINNNLGITDISTFSTSINGDVIIANLSLKVIGSGISPLNLNVNTLSDSNGNLIPYTIQNGQITIASILRGDMDCDGKVDIGDALLIAQYVVGLRPTPYIC